MTTKILLILGPTGVGKSTVIHELQQLDSRYTYISPYTTRILRQSESDKVSVSTDEFKRLKSEGKFVVVNQLYGAYYGTPREPILDALKKGLFPVIDWPIQNLESMKISFPKRTLSVYLEPQSFEALKERFVMQGSRGTERLEIAGIEYKRLLRGEFDNVVDHRVINGDKGATETARTVNEIYSETLKETYGKTSSENMSVKMKRDKFRSARGGRAVMLDVHCSNCDTKVLWYQKDGSGSLMRCYLNRIFAPPELEKLQKDQDIREPKDMPNLDCPSCKTVIGTPMRYTDGRLGYRLRPNSFYKTRSKDIGY